MDLTFLIISGTLWLNKRGSYFKVVLYNVERFGPDTHNLPLEIIRIL